ncbi:hypothetical protein [Haliea atlantica]
MKQEINFHQAIRNGARAVLEETETSFGSVFILAERHLATAQFLENERAVTYWQAVVRYCRHNGIS